MKGVQNNYMINILKNEGCVIEIPGGRLTEPLGDYTPYNLRALNKYCEERGVLPKELSDNELKQFELEKK